MENIQEKLRQDIALFRYRVIADLVHLPPGTPGMYTRYRKKAEQEYSIPGSTRTRVAADTIRDWLTNYRNGGFDALLPAQRSDAGQSRSLPDTVADQLIAIKEAYPHLSIRQIIQTVKSQALPPGVVLSSSTVHRLFTSHGFMQNRPTSEDPSSNDRRRFEFAKSGDMWMSDVMHGPSVYADGRRKRKAYLIAFIDDTTRVIPHAAFALSEKNEAFMEVFKKALIRRGVPKRLYVDNGSAFRCRHLELVCAKLGVTLIHARAYQPQGKGKMERWFRTVRMQFLPTLTEADTASLEALNRRLWGYVEGEYHHTPHRSLDNETPLDRFAKTGDEVRYVEPGCDLDDLFLCEAKRKVQRDRTISLDGVVYEVDASLVGETVLLRHDPSRKGHPIQVWHDGKHIHDASVVDAYVNCFVRRNQQAKTLYAIPKQGEDHEDDASVGIGAASAHGSNGEKARLEAIVQETIAESPRRLQLSAMLPANDADTGIGTGLHGGKY